MKVGAGACFIARGSGGRRSPYIYSMTKRSLYRRSDVRQSEHFCSEVIGPLEQFAHALHSLNRASEHYKEEFTMPKDMHEKAAEHHEQTAKTHRTAAQQHGTNDHVGAKQQSAQAVEKSKAAHEHSTQANNKSQQK
jgi:hypothetical protein